MKLSPYEIISQALVKKAFNIPAYNPSSAPGPRLTQQQIDQTLNNIKSYPAEKQQQFYDAINRQFDNSSYGVADNSKGIFGNAFSSLKGGLNDIRHGLIDWWRGGMDYASKGMFGSSNYDPTSQDRFRANVVMQNAAVNPEIYNSVQKSLGGVTPQQPAQQQKRLKFTRSARVGTPANHFIRSTSPTPTPVQPTTTGLAGSAPQQQQAPQSNPPPTPTPVPPMPTGVAGRAPQTAAPAPQPAAQQAAPAPQPAAQQAAPAPSIPPPAQTPQPAAEPWKDRNSQFNPAWSKDQKNMYMKSKYSDIGMTNPGTARPGVQRTPHGELVTKMPSMVTQQPSLVRQNAASQQFDNYVNRKPAEQVIQEAKRNHALLADRAALDGKMRARFGNAYKGDLNALLTE